MNEKNRFTFRKNEHLCSRKSIEAIINYGKAINEPPFRLSWIEDTDIKSEPLKIAISVPKRFFKRAVDRNSIKRIIREAYRLQKAPFLCMLKDSDKCYHALLIYTGKEIPAYRQVEDKIILTLQRFVKEECGKYQ
jgi:ribonuclease P protein component